MRRIVVLPLVIMSSLTGCGAGGADAAEPAPVPAVAPAAAVTSSPTPAAATASVSASPTGTPAAASAGVEVTTSETRFGEILFDAGGQAIYLFDKETTSKADCYGACAEAWPPVLTRGPPQGAGGVKASLLGTTERTDGEIQVTYAGHPLYFYAHEGKNEVECHKVRGFGGLWLAVAPSGRPAD